MNQQSEFLLKLREVVSSAGVPLNFSKEAIREATEVESEFKWPFIGKRLDLRGKTSFTMGSKEVAFSIEKENEDFIVGIHSADVAMLFPLDSPLDESAYSKGKTVVLPEKRHFMIPEAITTGFCSMREGEECFTVTVFLHINSSGKVKSVSFAESVVKITANCEPEEVEALLFDIDVSSVGFLRYKYYSVLKQMEYMFVAGALLKMARQNRGGADVDTAVRMFMNNKVRGNVTGVCLKKLSDPDRLVREIISAAGVEIAKFFNKRSIPCPYRKRDVMSQKGNKELREFLNSVSIDSSETLDKDLVLFAVDSAHGNINEELILAKVKELLPTVTCSLEPKYHGGMGAKYYVRFAYPASRYGDLAVQRLIKSYLNCGGNPSEAEKESMLHCATKAVLAVMGSEPKAKAVEKRASDLYALEILRTSKAKSFNGTVWSVSESGIEICLDNSCKGFLKAGGKYTVGQRIKVKVQEASLENETVFFEEVKA